MRPPLSSGALTDLCVAAESAGAGALWALDHLFWPVSIHECLTTLAVAAAATRSLAIGSCVLQLPLRQPAAVAKQAAALQHLSGGRLILGLGVGSHRAEYEAAGVDFAARGIAMDEGMTILRRCWQGDLEASPYQQLPPPPPIPLWIGGSSAPAMRRAGTRADGWIPLFLNPTEYRAGLEQVQARSAAAGREGEVFPAAVVMVSVGQAERATSAGLQFLSELYSLPAKAFARHLVSGPAPSVAARIEEYFGAGAQHVALMVCHDDALGQFASLADALGERMTGAQAEMVPV